MSSLRYTNYGSMQRAENLNHCNGTRSHKINLHRDVKRKV